MTPRSVDDATAYHEAGHVVAAWALNRGVRRADIHETGLYLGTVKYFRRDREWSYQVKKAGRAARWGGFVDARIRKAVETDIMIMLAGGLTEMRAFGLERHEVGMGVARLSPQEAAAMAKALGYSREKVLIGSRDRIEGGDYGDALDLALSVSGGDDKVVRPYLNWLEWRTTRLIQRPDFLPTVETVARALKEERELSGRKLGQIIRESQARETSERLAGRESTMQRTKVKTVLRTSRLQPP